MPAEAGLVLITAIWGATFVVVKDALAAIAPFPLLATRFGLAAAVLFLAAGRRRAPLLPNLVIGVWLFAGFALQTIGLQAAPPATAAFITGLSVVLVPLLGRRPCRWSAVALATLGLALLTLRWPPALGPGDLWLLGCAVAFALQILAVERYGRDQDPLPATALQMAVAAALALPLLPLQHQAVRWSGGLVLALLGLALPATAGVFWLQNRLQKTVSAARTAIIFTLEPVFALLWSWLLTGQGLPAQALLGGALCCAAMLLAP